MDLFAEYQSRIESVLNKVLPKAVDEHWFSRIAGQSSQNMNADEADMFLEPGRALLGRGGKRWRPMVTILTCEALGGGTKADILTALTEIPHNGSLIIDDVEDSALMRRGAPAIHLDYGLDLAVNMGNLMYFLPAIVLEQADFDEVTVSKMTRDWLCVMRRLHLGQGYDIVWHRNKSLFPDRDSYLLMCRYKTGSLSALAARLGVLAAMPTESLVSSIGDVWEKLGMGFQVLDDVQNLSTGVPGKDMGDDIVEGKKSLPVIIHLERCPEDDCRLAGLFERAAQVPQNGDWEPVMESVALIKESGAIDEARKLGQGFLESGRTAIKSLLPDSTARDLLVALVDGFQERMV